MCKCTGYIYANILKISFNLSKPIGFEHVKGGKERVKGGFVMVKGGQEHVKSGLVMVKGG
tara:strand:- start:1826 stop:2005 length:180 start_codon:yes stop_codon:yes gene_type:complete